MFDHREELQVGNLTHHRLWEITFCINIGTGHYLSPRGVGWWRNGGPSNFLNFLEHGGGGGAWKVKRRVWGVGVFLNKSKKLSFVVFWYHAWREVLIFFRRSKGVPEKNTNGIRLGSGIVLHQEHFLLHPPTPTLIITSPFLLTRARAYWLQSTC